MFDVKYEPSQYLSNFSWSFHKHVSDNHVISYYFDKISISQYYTYNGIKPVKFLQKCQKTIVFLRSTWFIQPTDILEKRRNIVIVSFNKPCYYTFINEIFCIFSIKVYLKDYSLCHET